MRCCSRRRRDELRASISISRDEEQAWGRETHHEGSVDKQEEGEESPSRCGEASHKVDNYTKNQDPRKGEGDLGVR